jgi:TatD DNase family protein
MIDIHTHLNFAKFNDDYGAVITRAKQKGVKKFIVPSSNLENSRKAIIIAEKYPEVFAAIGVHPIYGKEVCLSFFEDMRKLLSQPKIVAIGEVGLDYYYLNKESKYNQRYPNEKEQEVILRQMIKMAEEANLPLILHCRDAYFSLSNILKQEGGYGVIHCFMGNKKEAKQFLDLGFYLSFCGNITFNNDLDEVIEFVPLEKMLIETDSPFLAPEPYRGKRNEPAYIIEIAKKIAQVKKKSLAEVELQTDRNAEKLFKI